jgi:hypothetical protein
VALNDPPMCSPNVNPTEHAPVLKLTERVAFPIGGGGGSGSASLPSNLKPELAPPPLKRTKRYPLTPIFARQLVSGILAGCAAYMKARRNPDYESEESESEESEDEEDEDDEDDDEDDEDDDDTDDESDDDAAPPKYVPPPIPNSESDGDEELDPPCNLKHHPYTTKATENEY